MIASSDIELPYGRAPLRFASPRGHRVLGVPTSPPSPPLAAMLADALDAPIGAPPLERLVERGARVTIVISDATRKEPRDAMVRALLARLPDDIALTIAVATGTHGPAQIGELGLGSSLLARARLINHDGHRDDDLVAIGTTARGTPVRVHRCAVDADLVIATGVIRPHYFAGFAGGVKALFPGLGGNHEIRINHAWKSHPLARAGELDENPCRADLEDAGDLIPAPTFALNLVAAPDGGLPLAVAGALRAGFRAGAEHCRRWASVSVPRAHTIVVSDGLPVTASLYQASKLVAAVAPLLCEGGTIVLVAECADGVGRLAVVNDAIYAIGLKPRLPLHHRIVLISGLSPDLVDMTYCTSAPTVEEALHGCDDVLVVPRANALILHPA